MTRVLNESPLLTAYYDGQCSLCSAEMAEIVALDSAGDIALVDCSAADFQDALTRAAGISRNDLLGSLHVRDVLGDWHRGVDAIALLYATVGAPWLARAWAHPLTRPLTQRLYPWVVRHRQTLSRLGLHLVAPRVLRLFAQRHQQRHVLHCAHGSCRIAGGAVLGSQPLGGVSSATVAPCPSLAPAPKSPVLL